MRRMLLALAVIPLFAAAAHAQVPDLSTLIPAGDASASGRIVQLVAVLTVLSIAPGLLIMVTSFTRFVIALSGRMEPYEAQVLRGHELLGRTGARDRR